MHLEIFLPDFAVFRVFWDISRDFAEIPEFCGSATARIIRSAAKLMENLERSWKNSWKVLEFEELKRVQTLFLSNKQYKECLQLVFLKQIFVYFEVVVVK